MVKHLLVALAVVLAAANAQAEPLRLRADALASTPSPAGLVVLTGEARPSSWANAEAVIWGGSGENPADALVALIRLRDPGERGDLTLGRFVLATGAVRPIHLDGGWLRARLPAGLQVEAFGGRPVTPITTWNDEQRMSGVSAEFDRGDWDWAFGGRVSETVAGLVGGGLSYVERRDYGRVSDREVGADLWLSPTDKVDIATRLSWDVEMSGLSEAHVSAAARLTGFRIEAFGMRRSPALLLPATSIFSALGDVPSDTAGLAVTWYAAPRLDVLATTSARWAGEQHIDQNASNEPRTTGADLGIDATARATLRLDDQGAGQIAIEATRFGLQPNACAGLGLRLRVPVVLGLAASAELEVARPDESRGRGNFWPWGIVSFGGRFAEHWEAAAAVEASSSPDEKRELAALLRLAYRWEGRAR